MHIKTLLLLVLMLNKNIFSAETCSKHKTCGKCKSDPNICIWCSNDKFSGPRCQPKSKLKEDPNWCEGKQYDPMLEFPKTAPSVPLGEKTKEGNIIQFHPQSLKYKAKPGDVVNFTMSYKPARDYALDLYYLMDISYTMNYHKNNLKAQAELIHNALQKLSNNVRFGVGSFIEKKELPFTGKSHNSTYAFKNDLSLTENMTRFSEIVGTIASGGNYDTPEDVFDGVMQAMVCDDIISWRKEARRIIVVSTDAPYHSAGDGKFVGAILPNVDQCLLTNNIYGKESLIYDYPSVNKIHKVSVENNFYIMFVVDKHVKDVYVALEAEVTMSQTVELSNNSDTVKLIEDVYMKVIQNLEITRTNLPEYIDLVLDPPCTNENPYGFKINETVSINAVLKVTGCPSKRTKSEFNLRPGGLAKGLDIQLEVDCECDCEKEGNAVKNSPMCGKHGTYQCGVCKCNYGWHGDLCECVGASTIEMDLQNCKANINDTQPCSGRGTCQCGTCINCGNYLGKFCQYSVEDCPMHYDRPCDDHGKCVGKKCECEVGWAGADCSCAKSNATCIGDDGQICSNQGVCICGECVCNKSDDANKQHSGQYCNHCKGCVEEHCTALGSFVQCYFENKDNKTCNKTTNHNYQVKLLNRTEINQALYKKYHDCRLAVNGTVIIFKFHEDEKFMKILIQIEKEPAPVPRIWVHVGTAIGVIFLIGVLTAIIWKILIDMYDKKEYDRFKNECASRGFDVSINPLFQPAATLINNPAYGRNSQIMK